MASKDGIQEVTTSQTVENSSEFETLSKIQFMDPEKPSRAAKQETGPVASVTEFVTHEVSANEKTKSDAHQKHVDIDEHLLSPEEVAERYHMDINTVKPSESYGLSENHAHDLLNKNGPNILTPPKKKHPIIYLGAVLIGVAFLNAFIEFYQLQKSAAILESFLSLIPQKCHVIREGKLLQVEASTLVQGDIVLVRMGDKVPADLFIFAATDMKVDNSSLTGESEPQERSKVNTHKSPLEASNLCFYGTLVVSGEGYGIVIRTGDHTVLGQIAGLTASEKKKQISGLPATVTVLLTIAAKRMAAQNVLVKDLQGVETLGAITLLATDKTGTLTRNQMTVTYIWASLNLYSAFRNTQNENDLFDLNAPGIQEIVHSSLLCSRVKFDRVDVPIAERQILGDATETGLVRFAASQVDNFDDINNAYPKVFEIPFNSDTKWALTIHKKKHDRGYLTLYIKGAPERVLKLCSTILSETGVIFLTSEHRQRYDEIYEFMASKGHRVLAFAQLLLPGDEYPEDYVFNKEDKNYPLNNLCFVGLVSLEDPPKHGVREAIGRCRTAGIRVIMVTGDHPLTAEAIGRKINLMLKDTKALVAKKTGRPIESITNEEYNAIVVHGERIDSLSDADWDNIFSKNEIIFARTSPRHKLEIVKRAQSMGHIVGVTGDGVNDSPALKKADLGIAMNKSGSDVSKEAAAMILLDDNFASTVKGIEEGRLIFINLKKSIQYTISHTAPEVIVSLLFVIVPIPLPLTPILVLLVDLGFELLIALTFAWDKPESKNKLMKLLPRKPVTPTSIKMARLRALRRTPTITDPESGQPVIYSKMSQFFRNLKKPFTRTWWSELFEKSNGEVLVDGNLLSWAYLEIGIIEALGCVVSYFVVFYDHGLTPYDVRYMQQESSQFNYFTSNAQKYTSSIGYELDAEKQMEALNQAVSICYLAILIQQMFNLFACKSRYRLPFGKFMFSNPRNFIGLTLGFILTMLIVYVPPLNRAFKTSYKLSPKYWFIPVAFGVFILLYVSARTAIKRRAHPLPIQDMPELQMYPTIMSVERKV
ncbi:15190_t:CDS:2 [Racocetra fulgida]|uniref:15190_t:CDS:1 n=1 Tax=Racocetra fulgida TaxID=60492 RepID=A0A9N8ZR68_9GLOM|nr:15190_t:CDS:2 [Racocetra fulgida]